MLGGELVTGGNGERYSSFGRAVLRVVNQRAEHRSLRQKLWARESGCYHPRVYYTAVRSFRLDGINRRRRRTSGLLPVLVLVRGKQNLSFTRACPGHFSMRTTRTRLIETLSFNAFRLIFPSSHTPALVVD